MSARVNVAALLMVTALAGAVKAEDPPPFGRASLTPATATVGQPVTLTVDVFVPSYFTGAPRFPTLEVRDAVVVFDDEGNNLNETSGGHSFAGQRRSYRIFPQRAGRFEVAAFDVKVRFAVAGTTSPITPVSVRGGSFEATVPEAARGLDYFIATPRFTLAQKLDRSLDGLRVGDSLTRTVSMTIDDAFAMMLPPLEFPRLDGLAAYPAQPRVSDSAGERGATRVGERIEAATYVMQKAGDFALPAIDIAWWDTTTRELRHATLPALSLHVVPAVAATGAIALPPEAGVVAPDADPLDKARDLARRYWRRTLVALLALGLLLRVFGPRVRRAQTRRARRKAREQESAEAYLSRVGAAAHASAAELLEATYQWLDRRGSTEGRAARLEAFAQSSGDPRLPALAAGLVTAALADPNGTAPAPDAAAFVSALKRAAHARPAATAAAGLEPLNPR